MTHGQHLHRPVLVQRFRRLRCIDGLPDCVACPAHVDADNGLPIAAETLPGGLSDTRQCGQRLTSPMAVGPRLFGGSTKAAQQLRQVGVQQQCAVDDRLRGEGLTKVCTNIGGMRVCSG